MLRSALLWRFPALASLPEHTEAVGGAVRDLLLDVIPNDVDVECDDPQACASVVGNVIPLGRGEFVVYRVVIDGRVYDFSRREDLGRRDFTINAIAVDLTTDEVRDPFGGQEDIRRRLVRMIDAGNFQDDPLRMLRAVRLAVRLGFAIDEATIAAVRRRTGRILTVAAERVTYEMHAIFSAGRFREALRLFHETALDEPLFGHPLDAERFHADDVPLAAAYALLLRDPRAFAERWRWSDALLREVRTLQGLLHDGSEITLYDAGEAVGRQLAPMLRAIGRPEVTIPPGFYDTRALLDGNEIAAAAGIGPGPRLGALKRSLLEAQLRGEVCSREDAERFVKLSASM
jgi:tRNA nucleotidyltransferase/poly(A) polymerase